MSGALRRVWAHRITGGPVLEVFEGNGNVPCRGVGEEPIVGASHQAASEFLAPEEKSVFRLRSPLLRGLVNFLGEVSSRHSRTLQQGVCLPFVGVLLCLPDASAL